MPIIGTERKDGSEFMLSYSDTDLEDYVDLGELIEGDSE